MAGAKKTLNLNDVDQILAERFSGPEEDNIEELRT
jgi:hypothetical protein